jgi:DHA2 family multidrug resistance protein
MALAGDRDKDWPVTSATWAGFAMMCVGMFMAILDIQIVATSLPTIQTALDMAPVQMSWVQTAYLIAEVIAIPLTGLFTRVLTMRWLFVVAIGVFTMASIGCAASGSFAELVVARVLQGFAGGTLIPAVFSAVFLLFPFRLQGIATTVAGVLAVLAPTLGPVAGGWITVTYSWHWLFLVNVVPGVVSLIGAGLLLPAERIDLSHVRQLDWLSLMLMALTLAALEIALKEGPQRGWSSPPVLALLAATLVLGAVFIRRTVANPRPVVELRTLADRGFAIGCFLSFALGMGLFGSIYLMPVFLAFVREHTALRIGEIMLVTGTAQLVTAPIAVALERRLDARMLTLFGFALFGLGLALSAFATRDTDFDGMFWPQLVRGTAIMFCLLPPTRLALGHLAAETVPDASGLFNLMRNLGGAIGLALIDTILYGRAPVIGDRLKAELLAGSAEAAIAVGIPPSLVVDRPPGPVDEATEALVRPLVEKAALVMAINEAWAMLAAFMLIGLVTVPFAVKRGR